MILAGRKGVFPVVNWELCIFVLTINNYVSSCIFIVGPGNKNPGLPQWSWNWILDNRFKFEEILSHPPEFLLCISAQMIIRRVLLTRIWSSQHSNSTSLPGGCLREWSSELPSSEAWWGMHSSSEGRPGTSGLRPPGVSVFITYPTDSWE